MRSSIEAGPTNGQEGHTNLPGSNSNKVGLSEKPGGQRESVQLVPTSSPLKEKDLSDLRCFFDKWERSRTGRCTAWGACRWGSTFSFPCFFLFLQVGNLIKAMIIIGCAGAPQLSDLTQTAPVLSALVLNAGKLGCQLS